MACTIHFSPLSLLFIFNILLAITGQAVAGREIPKDSKNPDIKKPETFTNSDTSFYIPGIGKVRVPSLPQLPPLNGGIPFAPYTGGSIGGSGLGGGFGTGSYIPGADDTFIPNPGYEIPNPAYRGVPAPIRP